MGVALFIYLLFVHWVGDFVLQTRWMADNKSKNWEALTLHVYIYSVTLWMAIAVLNAWQMDAVCQFVLLNFIIHWIVDCCTSNMTRWALEDLRNVHYFFAIVGLDQFLHGATLLLTSEMLGKPTWVQ